MKFIKSSIMALALISLTGCAKNSLDIRSDYLNKVNNEAAEYCEDKGINPKTKNGCYFKYKVKTYYNDVEFFNSAIYGIENSWLKPDSEYKYNKDLEVLNDPPKLEATAENIEKIKYAIDKAIADKYGITVEELREIIKD